MVLDIDLMAELRRYFGLNLYEVKIWTSLLSRGVSTAGELSEISNVPRSRAYDILESLEKKGFVIMKLGKPIKYMAIPPEEVVDRAKNYMVKESEKRVERLDSIRQTGLMSSLNTIYTEGIKLLKPNEYSGIIKGRSNILNHLNSMIKNAKKEVIMVTTEKAMVGKLPSLKRAIVAANKKGVRIKFAAPLKDTKDVLGELKNYVEFKKLKDNSGRFVVVDNSDVLVMIKDYEEVHPNYDTGIWVNSPMLANSLSKTFEKI
jgi:sugar-specific transcriptional regulator TrmB